MTVPFYLGFIWVGNTKSKQTAYKLRQDCGLQSKKTVGWKVGWMISEFWIRKCDATRWSAKCDRDDKVRRDYKMRQR